MNSSSILSSRVSRSSSRNRARSLTVSGGSSPACSRRYMPTQLPRVPSLMPSSFATLAIGRDVSITIFTASSLNSGEKLFFARGNYFTFPDVHPIGWTVRKSRGTSLRPADHHRPPGRARQDRAETRLPLRRLAPLLHPPHRRRTRLRHRQGPRHQRHHPRLVPPDGPGTPDAVHRRLAGR